MLNSIKADLLRVQRKKSLIIMTLLTLGLCILFTALIGANVLKGDNSALYTTSLNMILGLNTLLIGIPVFNAVFSDDFKSRSMQVSIGYGVSRTKMILIRFFEFLLTFVEVYIIFTAFVFLLGAAIGVDMDTMVHITERLWRDLLLSMCYCAFAMIFVYFTQNGTLGLVAYILLVTSAFTLVFSGIDMLPILRKHDISIAAITIDGMYSSLFDTSLADAKRFMWGSLLIGCYVILPMILTIQIFKHKELDF